MRTPKRERLVQIWFEGPALLVGGRSVLLAFAISLLITVCVPSFREQFRMMIRESQAREVLSSVEAFLDEETRVKIVKLRTDAKLYLEVYKSDPKKVGELIQRIELIYGRDGYFMLKGQASNLAVVYRDGVPEIVSPSFDDNMVAHLHVFRYNPLAKLFEVARPQ